MDDLLKNENQENAESVDAVETAEETTETAEVVDTVEATEAAEDVAQPEEVVEESKENFILSEDLPEQPPVKKKKKFAPVIAVLVAVAAVACFFLFGNSDNSVDDTASNLFNESLVTVCKDGKWGYMNKSGEIVIKCQFDDAGLFTEDGLARIKIGEKYGFVDKTGTFITNPQYDWASSFSDGFAVIQQGDLYGYINTDGKIAINPQYDEAYSFGNGYAIVVVGENWGIIDEAGKYVINPQYGAEYYDTYSIAYELSNADNVKKVLLPAMKNEKYGYIDIKGNTVIDFQFDSTSGFDENGYALVSVGSKVGLIDKKGKYILNTVYDDLWLLEDDLYCFCENNKYGLIDTDGTEIAAPQFDSIVSAGDGYLYVVLGDKIGLIDLEGKYVINPVYAQLYNYSNGLFLAGDDTYYGYVNAKGEQVIALQFDDASGFADCGVACVRKGDRYGYINTKGEYVINSVYHYASYMSDDGFAWVVGDDKKMSIIDKDGNVIAGGLDGVNDETVSLCTKSGCYEYAEYEEKFCEEHMVNFYVMLEKLGYADTTAVTVTNDGMRLYAEYYFDFATGVLYGAGYDVITDIYDYMDIEYDYTNESFYRVVGSGTYKNRRISYVSELDYDLKCGTITMEIEN